MVAAEAATLPLSSVALEFPNTEDHFDGPDYNENRTVVVAVPQGALKVEVAAIITGHGSCEFQPTSHHFLVGPSGDGSSSSSSGSGGSSGGSGVVDFNTSSVPEYYDRFMLAGSAMGCTLQVGGTLVLKKGGRARLMRLALLGEMS